MASADTPASQRVGEVVQASSTTFATQCYQLYHSPPLGALVRAGSPGVYGVVYLVSTQPLEPSRPVLARGEGAATEEEVYQNNPQIARLLTSRFEALVVGHQSNGGSLQFLPPLPPRVHSFVYPCPPAEVVEFTSRLDFLTLVVSSGLAGADEVVGACLRQVAAAHPDRRGFLLRAGRALATELAGDVARLNTILRRVAP